MAGCLWKDQRPWSRFFKKQNHWNDYNFVLFIILNYIITPIIFQNFWK